MPPTSKAEVAPHVEAHELQLQASQSDVASKAHRGWALATALATARAPSTARASMAGKGATAASAERDVMLISRVIGVIHVILTSGVMDQRPAPNRLDQGSAILAAMIAQNVGVPWLSNSDSSKKQVHSQSPSQRQFKSKT
jgi:hypothetical protein